jgi:putative flavoprotein involved in K+ transport
MKQHKIDILIIGAGQAGLALAYYLKSTNLSYQLVEGNRQIGDSWRKRYDALTLFTPRSFSALPGLALTGDPDGYATRDEFADYLDSYASHFAFPIQLEHEIRLLEQVEGAFQVTTEAGDIFLSRVVVLATGPFQKPKIPAIAKSFAPEIQQFTPETYKNAAQIPAGNVLVVGDGATGRDLANELAKTHTVLLATGRSRRLLPEKFLGKSVWWWLDKLGMMRISANSALGQYMRRVDPFPARGNRLSDLQRNGVQVKKSLVEVKGKTVHFSNGDMAQVDTVIWATGYQDNSNWVAIPEVKDDAGNFIHSAGISPVKNLYFIGRSWQRTRGSALVTGVGEDALYLTKHILQTWNVPQANLRSQELVS